MILSSISTPEFCVVKTAGRLRFVLSRWRFFVTSLIDQER